MSHFSLHRCAVQPNLRGCLLPPLLLLLVLFLWMPVAYAAEVTWTGTAGTSWSDSVNWVGGSPTKDDVVIIPLTANQPEIDSHDAICRGVILENGASITVLAGGSATAPFALYIGGDGDLDGDVFSDVYELNYSVGENNFDADGDGLPNYDDSDSDEDGLSDTCEYTYGPDPISGGLHPYLSDDPHGDIDFDGFGNIEECDADSDPTDPSVNPVAMPLFGIVGVVLTCALLAGLAVCLLRRAGPRSIRIIGVLFAIGLLMFSGYISPQTIVAATYAVNFADGDTIEDIAATASPGDTLEINGASARPWNGKSTYINKPITLTADGGTVFLGGILASFRTGVLGQGSLHVDSLYAASDHPGAIDAEVVAGSLDHTVFLGERFLLEAVPEPGWGFHAWADDASGTSNPLGFQVLLHGTIVTALFGPPGPDLASGFDTGPPSTVRFGVPASFDVVVRVENIGQTATEQSLWNDRLYLSRDSALDDNDFKLTSEQQRSSEVAAGTYYTATFSVTVPDVAPGRYYVLGVVDTDADVNQDIYRENNVAAAEMVVLDAILAQ